MGGSQVRARRELGSTILCAVEVKVEPGSGEAQALPRAGEGSFSKLWALISSLRVCFLVVLGLSACPPPQPLPSTSACLGLE